MVGLAETSCEHSTTKRGKKNPKDSALEDWDVKMQEGLAKERATEDKMVDLREIGTVAEGKVGIEEGGRRAEVQEELLDVTSSCGAREYVFSSCLVDTTD